MVQVPAGMACGQATTRNIRRTREERDMKRQGEITYGAGHSFHTWDDIVLVHSGLEWIAKLDGHPIARGGKMRTALLSARRKGAIGRLDGLSEDHIAFLNMSPVPWQEFDDVSLTTVANSWPDKAIKRRAQQALARRRKGAK